ncbi:MAG TPA: LytR C-terminal domain-containing protein [Actinomycetota bacterium]
MNVGTTRIVIVAALVVAGLVVLLSGFPSVGGVAAGGPGGTTSPSTSVSPSTSPTPTPEPPPDPQPAKKINFFVLNGTNSTGLAGIQAERLANQDLTPALNDQNVAAGDAPTKPAKKTIVYFRGGDGAAQNESDAQWVADTFYAGAAVRELSPEIEGDVVPAEANVVVLLGEDQIPSA